jgi:hypothetical protein
VRRRHPPIHSKTLDRSIAVMLFIRGRSEAERNPLHLIRSSKKDLKQTPVEVPEVFGSARLDAQYGDHSEGARPFREGEQG